MSADGSVVVHGGYGSEVRLYDLARGVQLASVPVSQELYVYPSFDFSADGTTLALSVPPMTSNGKVGTVRTWSLDPDGWVDAACAVAARDLDQDDWARYGVGPAPGDLRCVQ